MRARKSLGQHFLMHARTAERIIDAAELTKRDTVLEIGPGTGMLTAPLLARAKRVMAIETDASLFAKLTETFAPEIGRRTLQLIHGDIRAFDPDTIAGPYHLVANIPYYLTGEIIRAFLDARHKPKSMTLLVQREVAERIARAKKESLLSIAVKTYGDPRYAFTIPRGAFIPAPNVDSAVVTIRNIHSPFASRKEGVRFFEILKAGFAHKRKLLARNLEALVSKQAVHEAFAVAQVPEKARAEDLSVSDWRAVVRALS